MDSARALYSQSPVQEKPERINKSLVYIFKDDNDRDDVTSGNRLFHIFASAMGRSVTNGSKATGQINVCVQNVICKTSL